MEHSSAGVQHCSRMTGTVSEHPKLPGLFSSLALSHAPPTKGLLLQGGGLPVEHEDGSDPVEQELADPVEEAEKVRVGHGIAGLVPEPLHGLVQPDGHV